ncbi:MAG: four helix bundle protein [Candidatus Brocadiaceae bacterium]|nr:four helix bundle protein [Candidatus Brocadiaceae bacterium]
MNQEQMKSRTKEFAKQVINLCRQLPDTREGRLIGNQLFRAGTSVSANYRAVCRARSKADFIAKLGIVLEEADESLYWLEILDEMEIVKTNLLKLLTDESNELVAIFVTSINTAKKNVRFQM